MTLDCLNKFEQDNENFFRWKHKTIWFAYRLCRIFLLPKLLQPLQNFIIICLLNTWFEFLPNVKKLIKYNSFFSIERVVLMMAVICICRSKLCSLTDDPILFISKCWMPNGRSFLGALVTHALSFAKWLHLMCN